MGAEVNTIHGCCAPSLLRLLTRQYLTLAVCLQALRRGALHVQSPLHNPPAPPPPPYYLALAVCLQALRRGALHMQPDPLNLGQGVRPGGEVGNLRACMVRDGGAKQGREDRSATCMVVCISVCERQVR